MVAIRKIAFLLTLALIALQSANSKPNDAEQTTGVYPEQSLYSQTAAAALNRYFPSTDISFLLLDAHTGHVLAARWDHVDSPIPMGSLVKPFTALAYGEQHGYEYPHHLCRGSASGCWRPAGHGDLDLTGAIANSCNSYFRVLTSELRAEDMAPIADRYDFEPPPSNNSGLQLAGLGSGWRVSPPRLARAYLTLVRARQDSGVRQILDGMAQSAREGTGAQIRLAGPGHSTLVKTGTAPCTHSNHAPGDGFALVLTPEDDPRILLVVRVHGAPGSQAARVAGQMLARIDQ